MYWSDPYTLTLQNIKFEYFLCKAFNYDFNRLARMTPLLQVVT